MTFYDHFCKSNVKVTVIFYTIRSKCRNHMKAPCFQFLKTCFFPMINSANSKPYYKEYCYEVLREPDKNLISITLKLNTFVEGVITKSKYLNTNCLCKSVKKGQKECGQ